MMKVILIDGPEHGDIYWLADEDWKLEVFAPDEKNPELLRHTGTYKYVEGSRPKAMKWHPA